MFVIFDLHMMSIVIDLYMLSPVIVLGMTPVIPGLTGSSLITLMLPMGGIFHALHQLLLHSVHSIHQCHYCYFRHVNCIQYLIQPVLHGAAVADQYICLLDRAHIRRRRLKGMTVHPRRHYQRQIHPVTGNLPRKIIIRKDCGDHIQPVIHSFCLRTLFSLLPSAPGQCQNQKNSQHPPTLSLQQLF